MRDRNILISTLWIASALALLAPVLAAPIRTSGVAASTRLDRLRRNFVRPPGQPTTRLGAATATDAVLQANVFPPENEGQDLAENEEQDLADGLDEPHASSPIPCSFRKVPDRRSIAPRSILSLYPLRC